VISDYWADKDEVKNEYNLNLDNYDEFEAIVLAVAHEEYKTLKLKNESNVVFDIKSILDETDGKL